MSANRELKVLLCDMELAYAIYYAFPSKKPQYLSSKQIKEYFFVPCAAWKWEHEVNAHVITTMDDKKRFKKDHKDDYIIAVKLHQLFSEADIIVAHNGDAFDIKHANTLFIKHGLGPVPESKSVDTLKMARKYFAFAGNDLAHLCTRFKVTEKGERPDWMPLTEGCPKETRKTAKYCKQDVLSLEAVYLHLKPYIRRFPTLRRAADKITECDYCKSKLLVNDGHGFNTQGVYQKVRCKECGGLHRSKTRFEHGKNSGN